MQENVVKKKFEDGEVSIGTFFEIGNANVAEALSYSDLDYMIIDTEHGPFDVESVMLMLRSAELHQTTALVRSKDSNRNSILKLLDIGAAGLIIPQIHSVEEIRRIVEYGKYYPVGERGVAFGRCAGWGYETYAQGDIQNYFTYCNKQTLLIPQCETQGCLDNIEEIAKVEGVDGIFVGPYDLSVAMGIPTQFEKPEFKAAIDRIVSAVHAAGKFVMIYCADPQVAKARMSQGFDSVTVNNDVNLYVEALNALVKSIKQD